MKKVLFLFLTILLVTLLVGCNKKAEFEMKNKHKVLSKML